MTNNPDLTTRNTGYLAEAFWQRPGQPRLYWKVSAVNAALRRARKRGNVITDERGSVKGGPALTILRPDTPTATCVDCGRAYDASGSAWLSATNRCPTCRSRRALAGKRKGGVA